MHSLAQDSQNPSRDDLSLGTYFVQGLKGWGRLGLSSLRGIRHSDTPVRRLMWLALVLPAGSLLLCLHWLCFWLDDLLFPKARSIEIRSPVFVLGPPRCGTTHLHRVLALDTDHFVTSPAWEVFLAPTVFQKKVMRACLRCDRAVGSPFRKLVRWAEGRLSGGFDQTHPGSLADPEEDYFYLLPIMACSGMALLFPDWTGFCRLVPGLEEDSADARKRAALFYRFCLRKQLYAGPSDIRLLSKNASFSSWMDVLPELFPDAQWIACMRDPAKAVPSMLSTGEKALQDVFLSGREKETRNWLHASMAAHYRMTSRMAAELPPDSFQVVSQMDLKDHLDEVLHSLADTFDWKPDERIWNAWRQKADSSRAYTSSHSYSSTPDPSGPDSLQESFPLTPATAPQRVPENAL